MRSLGPGLFFKSLWPQFYRISPAVRAIVFSCVREYLFHKCKGDASVPAARPFVVTPSQLEAIIEYDVRSRLNHGGKMKPRRKTRRGAENRKAVQFRGREGSFAAVRLRGCGFKLVRVVAFEWELDERRLLSSLVTDKSFVFPDQYGDHCYHAVRIYMRSRLKAPESVCERWGSLMHMLWDQVCGWQPHRIVHRLFIRESTVPNQPALWAMIMEEIAARLYQEHGSPYISDPRSMCAEHEVSDTEPEFDDDMTCMVRTTLKENNQSRAWWRTNVCPLILPPQARATVVKAMANQKQTRSFAGLAFAPQGRGSHTVDEEGAKRPLVAER